MHSARNSDRAFWGLCALLFVVATAVTIHFCNSMSAMGGMAMPGGWTLSMAWMRMPGQTWRDAAASFLGMWVAMMVAMMLPSLMPMLSRHRAVCGKRAARLGWLTAIVGAGYFFVWAMIGMSAFVLGIALAALEMHQPLLARGVPILVGLIVLLAGLLQFTAWKAQQLACCREAPASGCGLAANTGTAWQLGLRLGLRCSYCCAGLTATLLALGIMDLRAMAFVTTAITLERLASAGVRLARVIGGVVVVVGLFLISRAAGL